MHFLFSTRLRIIAAALLSAAGAFATNSTTQTVTFAVTAVNEISVSGSPGTLTVSTSAAGAAPNAVIDNATRYAITTNGRDRKVTAALDSAMPAGVRLTARLAAPAGAISAGPVNLGTIPADVVTGISALNETGKEITYELSATAEAGAVRSQSRIITFTVTAGAM